MEGSTYEKLIQNLEDFVFIEHKIVTCVWLSQSLKIHINTAKQILHSFLEENGVKDRVLVTYIIGGELKIGSGIQLKLVDSCQREESKKLFSTLTTDHVYSVQKSPSSLVPIDIYNSNPDFYINCDNRRFCPIKPSREIGKREVKGIVVETNQAISKPQPKPAKPVEQNASDKRASSNSTEEIPAKQSKASPEKNTKNKAAKGGIADMFNKQNEKKKSDTALNKTEKKEEKKKPGGIGGFFQKQPDKKVSVDEPMDVDAEPHPIRETNNKIATKEKELPNKQEDENEDSKKNSAKEKKSKGKENRKKRKKRNQKEEEPQKKRKRIASVFSSDSESSGNEASDCEMEPDPPPASVPVQKDDEEEDIIPPTPGRKRVRKQIDKTYTDEDGFILTKKEYVYESCTDDETAEEPTNEQKKITEVNEKNKNDPLPKSTKVENSKKVSTKKSPGKKKSPNSNDKAINKQSSIMSFFKRK